MAYRSVDYNIDEIFESVRNDSGIANTPRFGVEVVMNFLEDYINNRIADTSCNFSSIPRTSEILLLNPGTTHGFAWSACNSVNAQTRDFVKSHFECNEEIRKLTEYLPNLQVIHNQPTIDCWQDTQIGALAKYLISFKALSDLAFMYNRIIFAGTYFQNDLNDKFEYSDKYITVQNQEFEFMRSCGFMLVEENDTMQAGYKLEDKFSRFQRLTGQKQHYTREKDVSQELDNEWWIWLTLLTGAIIVLTTVALLAFKVAIYRRRSLFRARRIVAYLTGDQRHPNTEISDLEKALDTKYNKEKYEISSSHFQIDANKILGSGEYGVVLGGTITRTTGNVQVAVKTIKRRSRRYMSENFLQLNNLVSEIKILSYIGNHENIVGLLGANTSELHMGNLWVFLEFCSTGSLNKYLKTMSHKFDPAECRSNKNIRQQNENIELQQSHQIEETLNEMHRWSREIANGMEFIASKRLIHGDLATRNILLNSEKTAKISDFGLSRRLYDMKEYVKTTQEALPWRWMSPEAMRRMEFSEKSDVWAYGVTLWEIFTLADTPYPGMSYDVNFGIRLAEGLNPGDTTYNDTNIHSIMTRCWEVDAKNRPTFSEIKQYFAEEENIEG